MITAWHLYQWYEETKFCGACGVRLRHGKEERTMVCPICGNTIYPRIYPAVIVGVYDGSRILLTKMSPSAQYYALVSGYCEAGETLEETARREVPSVRLRIIRVSRGRLLSRFYPVILRG